MMRLLSWLQSRQVGKPRRVILIVLLCCGVLGGLLLDYYAYPQFAHPVGRSPNIGENGLWLRKTWYQGEETDTAPLAKRLQREQIRYAYFYVHSIKPDGTLRDHPSVAARQLTYALHRQAPATKLLAWVYAGNRAGHGKVDLTQPSVRRKMVAEAVRLVTVCGFDRVQWDYELCPSGDAGFLALLRETRAALPPGKLLSVATPLWLPHPLGPHGWTEGDFGAVAALCDQMAVMCYDSGIYLPRGYVWLVQQQVVHVSAAVSHRNLKCRLLLGIPTYQAGGLSHHAPAENIRMALIGVRAGLADPRAVPSVVAGVAPFADYTTQEAEWNVYQHWWLQP